MNDIRLLVLSEIQSGGEWIATQNMLINLKKNKPEMEITYIGYSTDNNRLKKDIFTHVQLLDHIGVSTPPFRMFRSLWKEYKNAVASITQNLQTFRPTCIVSTQCIFTLAVLTAVQKKKIPVIYWFHGFRSCYFVDKEKRTWKERILFYLEKKALQESSMVIVPSDQSKKMLIRVIGQHSNIQVIHNSINKEFYTDVSAREENIFRRSLNIPPDTRILAYVGRIAPYKGLEIFTEAYIKVSQKSRNTMLILASPSFPVDRTVCERIQKKINSASMENSIRIVSGLNIHDLINLYKTSIAVFLPSFNENSPLVMWECMASGGLFIGSPAGDMEEILGSVDPRLIMSEVTAEQVKKKIYWALSLSQKEHLSLRLRLKEKACERMQEEEIKKLVSLLDL